MSQDQLIRTILAELPVPPRDIAAEALGAELTLGEHHRLAAAVAAFTAIQRTPAPAMPPLPTLHIAAWNAERLKFPEPSVRLV